MVVFAGVMWAPVVLRDPDTLWHIRIGEWILTHHAVPRIDTFSFTAAGLPWVAHEWLSEVLLAVAYDWLGWTGVLTLTAAAAGSVIGLVALYVRARVRADIAMMLVLLAAACAGPSLLSRPHLLALPLVTVWAIGLIAAREKGAGPPWILLPVMVVWANLHGGFLVGLVLAGALGVEAMFDPACLWRTSLGRWGSFLLAATAAAALTPHGIDGLFFPFQLMSMRNLYQIMEWKPSDFSQLNGMTVSILVGLYLGLTGRLQLPRFRTLLLIGLVFVTMRHVRNAQLFGILGPLLIVDALGRIGDRPIALTFGVPDKIPVWLAGAALAVSLTIRYAMPIERVDEGTYPSTALASVPAELRGRPVFNDYGFGGALIFSGVRPFIDGRADLYGDAFIDEYLSVVHLKTNRLDHLLCQYSIEWTLFGPESVVPALLDRTPGWRRLYGDRIAVVHVRDSETKRASCETSAEE